MPTEPVKNSTQSKSRKKDYISDDEKRAMEALARDAAGEPQAKRFLSPSEMLSIAGSAQPDWDPGELRAPPRFTMREGRTIPDSKAEDNLKEFMGRVVRGSNYNGPRPSDYDNVEGGLPIDPETRMMQLEQLMEAFKTRKVRGVPM